MLTTQAVLIITVVNTMLLRAAVLKTCCLSTKFHIVLHSLFVFELQRSIISQGFHYLGAVYMKVVFQLFSRLAGKKILFPRVHIRNISLPG